MSNQQFTGGNGSVENAKKRITRSDISQIVAASVKNSVLFACALILFLPTIIIPTVQDVPANSTLSLTDEEISWFSSLNYIATPIGCLVSGVMNNAIGRKRSMQVLTIPMIVSCSIYYFANSARMLWAAATVAGFVEGLSEGPVVTYLSEISEPHLRGMLSASTTFAMLLACFIVFLLGSLIQWRTIVVICGVISIFPFIALFFVPDSPHWLLSKKRYEDTQKALCWLRGWTTLEHVQDEYNELVRELHPEWKIKQNENELSEERKNSLCNFTIENYLKRTFILPFLLIFYTTFVCHFTGTTTVNVFAVNIFNSFGSPVSGYNSAVILGLTQLFGAAVCVIFIHYTGKRPLMFISLTGLGVVTGSAGLYGYFYLGVKKLDSGVHVNEVFRGMQQFSWLPLVCFAGIPFLSLLCPSNLSWFLIGEAYPSEVRSFGSGISIALSYVFGFISCKTFFSLIDVITLPGVFLLYAAIAFLSIALYYIFLPETEGWSLFEVQEHFAGKRNLIKAGRNKTKNICVAQGKDNPSPIEDDFTKL